jgi:hypothetical protein
LWQFIKAIAVLSQHKSYLLASPTTAIYLAILHAALCVAKRSNEIFESTAKWYFQKFHWILSRNKVRQVSERMIKNMDALWECAFASN